MRILTGLKIRVTTYKESNAYQSFYSYTLKNTPFYFRLVWDPDITDEVKLQYSNNQVLWDFGDGNFYTGPDAEHYYEWPGLYNVSAKIYDIDGEVHTVFVDNLLQVFNAVPDKVSIGGLDNFGALFALDAGKKSPPIKVARYNSWQYDKFLREGNYTVNLYASGSNSAFVSVNDYYSSQWAHLKRYYGFIERSITVDDVLTEKLVDSTVTTSVSVYAKKINTGNFDGVWDVRLKYSSEPGEDTVFCGTSGEMLEDKTLHFIDQSPSFRKRDSLILLYASFDNIIFKDVNYDKYSFVIDEPYGIVNTAYSTQLVKSIFNSASALAITSNGITVEGIPTDFSILSAQKLYSFDIYPIKFTNTKIPFTITLKDGDGYTTKCYPPLNLQNYGGLTLNNVKVTLIEIFNDGTLKEVKNTFFSNNTAVPVYEKSGSYFSGIFECYEPVNSVALSAIALIKDENKNIPSNGYCFLMQPGLNHIRRIRRLPKYGYQDNSDDFKIFITSERRTYSQPVSGGINITYVPAYMVNPLSGSFVWVTDSNTDFIFVFNEDGEKVCSDINLQQLRVISKGTIPTISTVNARRNSNNRSASPCNIAVNSVGDAWVTLYDCVTSFKLDKFTGVAKSYVIPSANNVFYNNLTYSSLLTSTSGFAGENLILPTSVDVDRNDNVYISYTHPLKSFVAKYSDGGTLLKVIDFPFPYTAKNILIDKEDNLWVTTFNNSPVNAINNPQTQNIVDRVDLLYYFNFKDEERSFNKEFSFLGDITVDSGGNVWANSENNIISRVTTKGEKLDFYIGSPQNGFDYVQDFGAFSGDLDGNLLIVNNTDGVLNYFDTIDPKQVSSEELPYIVLQGIDLIDPTYQSKTYYRTIGDFAGVRWYLKNRVKENTEPRVVTGVSNLFDIKDYTPVIVKKNENYDISSTFRGYVLQEPLFNNENLFDNFFKPILNGNTNSLNEIGKHIYEKISNFTDNISDIDKCNIVSLNSMYEMVGEKADIFFNTLPPGLLKTLDLLSIKKSILFGGINRYCENFVLSSFEYDPYSNLGPVIDIERGYFIPGYPIVSYDLFSKKYHLIRNTLVPESDMISFTPYPLSGVSNKWGWGLVLGSIYDSYKEIKNYYKFYNFIPSKNGQIFDGIIDFNDPLTTIKYESNTYQDWTKFGGGMEEVLTASLYNNLKLLNNTTSPLLRIPPSLTPSITPSVTPTKPVPPTPSVTPTLTVSVSITPSKKPSPSISKSVTPSKTPSKTPTVTKSPTPTKTPSVTVSVTPSQGFIPTLTPSHTPSKTLSPTPTPTPSITPTITPSKTATPSISPTRTPSSTPSSTVGASPSRTPSLTPSTSITPTVTPSISLTPSTTPTPSITKTPTKTPSVTPSLSPTPSVTPTIPSSPSLTPSNTPSITPSRSPNGLRVGAIYKLET
jgi:hypothetical protein